MTTYLLDTTVLIAHLRADAQITTHLLDLLGQGHVLATSAVNVAEVERGARREERRSIEALVDRLAFLPTTVEAARRAGRYQREAAGRGRTMHTPDALIAGTARAHGAVLVTHNVADFPMPDLTVERPPA